ncbi:MAG: inhibitor of KinA [Paracoccaceae bacterium]|jgi:inhibitor of KinA
MNNSEPFPRLLSMGLTGLLVSFSDTLSEPANRAAIAFRARLDRESWPGLEETSATLASVFMRFDPRHVSPAALSEQVNGLLAETDWYKAALPEGRKLWRIPTVYGGPQAPQLDEAAALAGVAPDVAIEQLSSARVRVLTLGYAPGQPYLGTLPENWNLPRQTALTPTVPPGALVVAVRQFVMFASQAPTGWRHVGQTGFRCFVPEADTPFTLRAGDEVIFPAVSPEDFANRAAQDPAGLGGASFEVLP